MRIEVAYESGRDLARLSTDTPEHPGWTEWVRTIRDVVPEARILPGKAFVPWFALRQLLRPLRHIQRSHGVAVDYSDEAKSLVEDFVREAHALRAARSGSQTDQISSDVIKQRLSERGWDFAKRELTEEQYRDAQKMLSLPHGANFSVPGAGKTTVSLAVHLVGVDPATTLLVIAPKNAFAAWDQVLADCLEEPFEGFVRLGTTEGSRGIEAELARRPARAIVSYGQMVRASETFASFMGRIATHLILDESHRIKAGHRSQTGITALGISHRAIRRDILSGTPMPNGVEDLAPQLDFLWPAHRLGPQITRDENPSVALKPFFCRTTKSELHIPQVVTDYQAVEMSDPQVMLYSLIRDDVIRNLPGIIAHQMPRAVNASVMRLLQVSIDPQAAVQAIMAADESAVSRTDDLREVCRMVLEDGRSSRMKEVQRLARELAAAGRKSLIWTPFRFTIESLVSDLADLGSVAIHGGVSAGNDDDFGTREEIIKRFHDDDNCKVLIANPAAGGEGISLHKVCHDAIYCGRTYNAAHFLQSRDRIHRLGLPQGTVTRLTVVEARSPARLGSIDLSVRRRLDTKIAQMDAVFNDPDLRAISLESQDADPTLDDGLVLDDLADLFDTLIPNHE